MTGPNGGTATIWWVRHGPTHRKEMVGWSDVPADLSDTAALARLLRQLKNDAGAAQTQTRLALR